MVAAAPRARILRAVVVEPLAALVGHAGAGKTVALHAVLADHDGPVVQLSAADADPARLSGRIDAARGELRSTTRTVLLAIDDLERTPAASEATLAELIDA